MQTASKMRQKGKEVLKKVEFCMERTLHYRRQLIVIDGVPISDILEQFPWLKGPGLLKEFSRISVANIVQELLQFLSDYGECLLKKVNNSKTEVDGVLKELIENAHKTKENEKYVASCIALLGVSFLLGEKCSNIVGENAADAQLAPVFIRYIGEFITCTDFDILIDSVVVFEGGDFVEAYTNYLAAFYVYNIEYAGSLLKTLVLMDRVILQENTKCASSLEKKVLSFISNLNTETNGGKSGKSNKAKTKHWSTCGKVQLNIKQVGNI